ncbi:MAG: outer membrane lipoprotein carrier protein LolA [Sneathiella sp.]
MRLKLSFLFFSISLILLQAALADPVRLATGEGLMGRFIQTRYLAGFDKPIVSEGKFFLLPKIGLTWQTEKPIRTYMIVDNDGIRQSIAGKEVSNLSISRFPALAVLRDVLENSMSGNWDPLEKMAGSDIVKDTGGWRLEFIPTISEVKLPFTALSFEMTDYLDKIEISKGENDKDVIIFFDQQQAPIDIIQEAAEKSKQAAH